MDMLVELNANGPATGIEMSIVRQSVCRPFVYPMPFELIFSVDWYRNAPDDYVSKMKGEDKEIFADVPVQDSMKEYDEGADITQGKVKHLQIKYLQGVANDDITNCNEL